MENNDSVKLQMLENTINEIKTDIKDLEKRIIGIEQSKERTDYQFDEIMKALNKLNDVTIPRMLSDIQDIKNRPAKKYDAIMTTITSTIVAGIVGFVVSKFTS